VGVKEEEEDKSKINIIYTNEHDYDLKEEESLKRDNERWLRNATVIQEEEEEEEEMQE